VAIKAFVTADDPIGQIRVRGGKLKGGLSEAILSADIDMGIDRVSQLTMVFADPGFTLLGTKVFKGYVPIDYEDLRYELTNLDTEPGATGRGQITVKARPLIIGKLKRRRGPLVMRNTSPSDFVKNECKAVGARYLVQPAAKRAAVRRNVKKSGEEYGNDLPSSWSTFIELAGQLGFVCFESGGTIYFGKPSWLVEQPLAEVKVRWGSGPEIEWADKVPNFNYSTDSDTPYSVSFETPIERARLFRPGRLAVMSGVPMFNGKYLIDSVAFSLAGGSSVNVTARTVTDPDPIKRIKSSSSISEGSTDEGGPHRGTKSAADMVYWALQQAGDNYVYGAEANLKDSDPDAFDCSELVEWACAQVGVFIPDGSANQLSWVRSKGNQLTVDRTIRLRGGLLFKYTEGLQHVAISLGNGRTIEASNREYGVTQMSSTDRSFRWDAAGSIPGLTY